MLFVIVGQAQVMEPVKMDVSRNDKQIVFHAKIKKGWHVYSVAPKTESSTMGPTWARLVVDNIDGAELDGELQAVGKEKSVYDDMFGMDVRYFEDSVTFVQKIKVRREGYVIDCALEYGTCDDKQCLPPQQAKYVVNNAQQALDKGTIDERESGDTGFWHYWGIFLAGLVGGLLALLTPCVWPMIPMTVSFFLKRNSTRRQAVKEAVAYGFSIVFIYLFLGIVVTLIFGAAALNNLATNAVANIIFALLLVGFAMSFFGMFELRLPDAWATRLDAQADALSGSRLPFTHYLSIALMALVLVVVSFSCTGPLIGVLLVTIAQTNSLVAPILGMLGFAVALAVPFAIFALFPNWLGHLPKSGHWMNMVKVSLAFVELAFALKFISVADLAYGWGILPRTLFVAIWLVLAIAWAVYLIVTLRSKKALAMKLVLLVLALMFSIYLSRGLVGNIKMKDISAFLPPMEQQLSATHFQDYEAGLCAAKKQKKLVFIDFTGYGCVNCRKMEAAVFTDARIRKILDEQYITITLFVDDRRPLTNSTETVGEHWSKLQQEKFRANAQPYYIVANANMDESSIATRSYDEDVEGFLEFLKIPLQ